MDRLHRPTGALGVPGCWQPGAEGGYPEGAAALGCGPRGGHPGISFCTASTLTRNKFPNDNINTWRTCAPVHIDLRTRLGVLTSLEVPGSRHRSFFIYYDKFQKVAGGNTGIWTRCTATATLSAQQTRCSGPRLTPRWLLPSLYLISASGPKKWCVATVASGRTLQYSSRGMSTVGEQGGTLKR